MTDIRKKFPLITKNLSNYSNYNKKIEMFFQYIHAQLG